jgi:hypothetical protein
MKFEESVQAGKHHDLNVLVGRWKGTNRVWFSEDVLVDESMMEGTMRAVLNGRFIIHEYAGSFQGKSIEGVCMMGYDLAQEKFQFSWVDSFHMSTGIMFSEGNSSSNSIMVLGSYPSMGEVKEEWKWRTTIDVVNEDEMVITMYNISPQGDEVKAVETKYKRVML